MCAYSVLRREPAQERGRLRRVKRDAAGANVVTAGFRASMYDAHEA
jgi:hypothetical protein